MWQDKIAISSILSPTGLKIIRVNKECLVYSGLYVTSNDLEYVTGVSPSYCCLV